MTPIRIRGKRNATKAQKWHARKARPLIHSTASSELPSDTSSHSESVVVSTRKRRKICLTKLELLPTEILQQIFDMCNNVSLPIASPYLAEKLSSEQIYMRTAFQLISPCLSPATWGFIVDTTRDVTRLLECRWFTWHFFRRWLVQVYKVLEADERKLLESDSEQDVLLWPGYPWPTAAEAEAELGNPNWLKRLHLYPTGVHIHGEDRKRFVRQESLLLPSKLLSGPWTGEKIDFLDWLASGLGHVRFADSTHAELAVLGMRQAFEEVSPRAVSALLKAGVLPTKDMLRLAVLDYGCDITIVFLLLRRALIRWDPDDEHDMDFLDAALWGWARKAQQENNDKGAWLMEALRLVQAATPLFDTPKKTTSDFDRHFYAKCDPARHDELIWIKTAVSVSQDANGDEVEMVFGGDTQA